MIMYLYGYVLFINLTTLNRNHTSDYLTTLSRNHASDYLTMLNRNHTSYFTLFTITIFIVGIYNRCHNVFRNNRR